MRNSTGKLTFGRLVTNPRHRATVDITQGYPNHVKHIGGYFTPEVSRQLRIIAAGEDMSIQNLLAESLDMLFHSRQMPTIA